MDNMFLSISYQIMLDCWRENPLDRPTFERLRNTMKEMERNHKVRRVRTFFKREKQSWIRKVHLGKKLIIIQGLKLRGVCSTSLPSSYLSKRLIKCWIGCCIYFSFPFAVSSEAVNFQTSIHYTTFITNETTTKPLSTWLAHLVEYQISEFI